MAGHVKVTSHTDRVVARAAVAHRARQADGNP